MALARFATCTAVEVIGPDTRVLTFASDDPVGFRGGQYLIVDTGLVSEAGKAIKRAYSFLTSDRQQARFTLASKRLPGGRGSGHMHEIAVGDRLKWSGPWGKMLPPAPTEEGSTFAGRTLVLATDTGITAALGLVNGEDFAALLPSTRFVWLRPDTRDFLPDEWVRARLPAGLPLQIAPVPPPDHPERLAHVHSVIGDDLAPGQLQLGFITGDGLVNYTILDRLIANGLPLTRDHVESFFNYPKKTTSETTTSAKAPSSEAASA